jgi:hypothetical protein
MTKQEIESRYQALCKEPSDINEHLPKLREYADKCQHITEMGVRGCVSLYAFLSSAAAKVVAIDILNVAVPEVEKLQFICADDLKIEIERTDFLFIDTAHNYKQLAQELQLHAGQVNKFIGFHDTSIFGTVGDNGGGGLLAAIHEFLECNREWKLVYQTKVNNGLTIIEKL